MFSIDPSLLVIVLRNEKLFFINSMRTCTTMIMEPFWTLGAPFAASY